MDIIWRMSLKQASRYFNVKQLYAFVLLGLVLSLLVVFLGSRTATLRLIKPNSKSSNDALVRSRLHTQKHSMEYARTSSITNYAQTPSAAKHVQTSTSTEHAQTSNITEHIQTSAPTTHARTSAVIILTYMRSGSSFTGDILQRAPGSFYLYEPLHYLGRAWNTKQNLTFVNGTTRQWPYSFLTEGVQTIRHLLNCDITKILENSLNDGFMERGRTSNGFRKCVTKENALGRRDSAPLYCALELKAKCEQSSIVIIKTIRMSLSAISHLLDEIPGLKIIHLVRDPRATLLSESRYGMCTDKKGGPTGCTNTYCTRLENDILESETLKRRYANRVKTLLYEELAREPIETSKSLFNFIGATFDAETEEFVYNITLAGKKADCVICSTRPNSTALIDAWRTNIQSKLNFLTTIEQRCNYALRYLNYTLLANSSRTDIDTIYS